MPIGQTVYEIWPRHVWICFVPSSRDLVTPPDDNRATAIGNMHKKFGNDRECGSGDTVRRT